MNLSKFQNLFHSFTVRIKSLNIFQQSSTTTSFDLTSLRVNSIVGNITEPPNNRVRTMRTPATLDHAYHRDTFDSLCRPILPDRILISDRHYLSIITARVAIPFRHSLNSRIHYSCPGDFSTKSRHKWSV